MIKLILLVLALLALYLIFSRPHRENAPPRDGKAPPAGAETMVACAYCGVHVPRGEAVVAAGRCYCCDEHRQRHAS